MNEIIIRLLIIVGVLLFVLNLAGLLTWLERRLLGLWQDRYGPNRVGPFGILQGLADAVKLFVKEDWIPPFADRPVFILAPAIVVITVLFTFAVIPFSPIISVADLNIGLLFFLAMSSMGAYSVVLAGWASGSKYSLIGGMRSAAQMISYEVFMGLSLMGVVLMAGSFNLRDIVEAQRGMWFCIPQFFGLVISTLFFGGWLGPFFPPVVWFFGKMCVFMASFFLLRATFPRPRFDQLMSYGWKVLLPIALLNLIITGGIILYTS
ncbi:MAG: NADH-quinone oxidoreductase subunit H [Acidobacteriota bacterium]